MTRLLTTTAALLALAAPAFADGDAAKGEKEFKKCKACHEIVAPDGAEIVKGGKVGPNLYGVVGRTAGTYPDFAYDEDTIKAGAAGLVWDGENLVKYLEDPTAFLQEVSGNSAAKSKMTFKLKKHGDDVVAYLASVAPAADGAEPKKAD